MSSDPEQALRQTATAYSKLHSRYIDFVEAVKDYAKAGKMPSLMIEDGDDGALVVKFIGRRLTLALNYRPGDDSGVIALSAKDASGVGSLLRFWAAGHIDPAYAGESDWRLPKDSMPLFLMMLEAAMRDLRN
jgi:hypothetical protein